LFGDEVQTYGKTLVPTVNFLNSYAAKKIGLHSCKWLLLFAFTKLQDAAG